MKKSNFLLISGIIGIIYIFFLILNFSIIPLYSENFSDNILNWVYKIILIPHILFIQAAIIFTWIGYFLNLKWCALVSGILYSMSTLLKFTHFPFLLIQIILCFVAFSKMKNSEYY